MFRKFRNASISTKVRMLFWFGMGIPLVFSCVAFCINDMRMIRNSQLEQVKTLAGTLAANSSAAVTFDDSEVATEILSSLSLQPSIDFACIYRGESDEVFATYRREGYEAVNNGDERISFEHFYTKSGDLLVTFPVDNTGSVVARIQLRANSDALEQQLKNITSIIIAVLGLSLVISTIMARIARVTVANPVQELANATRSVSSSADYSVRLNSDREDELGHLILDFNSMLEQIQHREKHLDGLHQKLQHAHDETLAASEAKSYFLANMSHEIRTPLTGILGFSDLLMKQGENCNLEKRQDYLQTIHSSGTHLLSLINDILDLSKIEAQQMVIDKSDCSPHELINEVITLLDPRATKKGISLKFSWLGGVLKSARTDVDRYRQILTNIIGNAVKFTEQGGVTVQAEFQPDEEKSLLVVYVSDTGIGISNEAIKNIFDPFVQADNSVTRRFGGTGLGLSISRKMALALGGDLTVNSEYNAGSTFKISIEVGSASEAQLLSAPPKKRVACEPVQEEAVSKLLKGRKILLAEDGETNRKLISLILSQQGLEVTTAENGEIATQLVEKNKFDLILMDMQMPVMDGYRASTHLRSIGCALPIIALTAHAMKGDEEKCLQAGCSGYLTKPIDPQSLIAKISESLGSSDERLLQGVEADEETPIEESGLPIESALPVDNVAFREIVVEFVEFLQEQLTQIDEAYQSNDYGRVAELAHMIKGSGGTAGYDVLTAPSKVLNDAAIAGDEAVMKTALETLLDITSRIVKGCPVNAS